MTDQMSEDNGGVMPEDQIAPEENLEPIVDSPKDSQELQPEAAASEADEEPVATAEAPLTDPVTEEEAASEAEMVSDDEEAKPLPDTVNEVEADPQPVPATAEDLPPAAETPAEGEAPSAEDTEPQDQLEEEPDDGRAWYVVHCYSGYENKVRHNLEQRIDSMGMKDRIFDVVVPTEEEIEVKEGKRKTVERRVFPGYILVNMVLTEESWYVVRNTPGVTSFVGQGNEPLPLRPEEVATIIKRMEADAPRIKVSFRQGERVRIVDGPFNDFRGTVDEIDMERAKVRVMVNFFGRETPVELDFLQVEKA